MNEYNFYLNDFDRNITIQLPFNIQSNQLHKIKVSFFFVLQTIKYISYTIDYAYAAAMTLTTATALHSDVQERLSECVCVQTSIRLVSHTPWMNE